MMEPTKRSAIDDIPKGLVCRTCGCRHFEVIYTRPGPDNKIIRRRECRHCGKRVTTSERVIA